MKKKVLIISLCLCLVLIAAGGTIAYFTAESPIYHNVITTGGVEIELLEYRDHDRTLPFVDVDGMMPGVSTGKVPLIMNTGEKPAWVRIQLNKRIVLSEQSEIKEPDTEFIELEINDQYWEFNENDGCYYYKRILQKDEKTEPLFYTVTISKKMGNGYKGSKAMIDLTGYAVQSDNNGTEGDWKTAKGWPKLKEAIN